MTRGHTKKRKKSATLPKTQPQIQEAVQVPDRESEPTSSGRRWFWVLQTAAFAIVLGWNAWQWYYWRRPLPDVKTLEGWIAAGRIDEAIDVLELRLRRSPHDGESRSALARIWGQKEEYVRCAEELRATPFWWPTADEALWREAQAWILANRARDAETAWRKFLFDNPQQPRSKELQDRVLVDLFNLWAMEDRWEELADLVRKLYPQADRQGRHELRVMSLRTVLERSSPTAAMPAVIAYLEADPEDLNARAALARFLLALGRWSEAEEHLRICLDYRNEDRSLHRTALELAHARGDWAGLAKALDNVPASVASVEPEVWHYRGLLAQYEGNPALARTAYLRAVELNPYQADARYRLAILLDAQGDHAAAREHRLRGKQLQQARAELPEALKTYNQIVRDRGLEAYQELLPHIQTLASLCRTLGLEHDAGAWDHLARGIIPLVKPS